jgi:hypothetical protein
VAFNLPWDCGMTNGSGPPGPNAFTLRLALALPSPNCCVLACGLFPLALSEMY